MGDIIKRLREELRDLNKKILQHNSIQNPSREILRRFVENQLYIIPHDLKALSHILSRTSKMDEVDFFKLLVDGDYEALKALHLLSQELNIKFDYSRLSPKAISYTHYLSWLALNGSPGDVAIALTVNLPVWGENVKKLGEYAKSLKIGSTKIFELFSGPYDVLEEKAEKIAERYLEWDRYLFIAKTIQRYELDFWDSLIED
ncbi:MAG: TenA family transcriptional regulator [Aigarchaeota archaeon]|nr:TenA family transcriptional regulator [Aigarchaeota archaeon]MCX8192698.1 TenA family transcriptional regulator [Nitrososphaeria archaeon]MDW7987002.1 TenA family transcriptional regulator [Nitrososphaerota archaeon]